MEKLVTSAITIVINWLLIMSKAKAKINGVFFKDGFSQFRDKIDSPLILEHCTAGCLHYYILGCCFAVCWKPSILGETSITLHEFIKGKMYRKPLFSYPDDLEHAKISQLIQDQVGIIFVASFGHVWLDASHVPV